MKIRNFLLERYFAKYEFNTQYPLSSSDCETFSIKELLQLSGTRLADLGKLRLGYTESTGNTRLLEKIAEMYSHIYKDDILAFSGAEEGIFVFMNVFLSPGDHIIVQYPAYQSLFEIARAIGCKISKWTVREGEMHWKFDLEDLAPLFTEKTKLLIINQPHNPTGSLFSPAEQQKLVEIATARNVFIFSDEVYRGLEYQEESLLPPMCDIYPKSISLGVMSKAYGLAGLRIGWTATQDSELLSSLKAFKDYTTICNSAPSEFLALAALEAADIILKRNRDIIQSNIQKLDHFFEKHARLFTWMRPKAGPVGFVRLREDLDVEAFCLQAIEGCGVLLLPSTLYGFEDRYFRIGFGRKNLPEALAALEAWIEKKF